MLRLVMFAMFVLVSSLAQAQTPEVEVNKPFSIGFDHNGINTSGYRIYVDNTMIADVPVSVLQAGSAQATIPATAVSTRGQHTVAVSAYNADNESNKTPLVVLAKLAAPVDPTNLRIVIQLALNPDGTIGVTWAAAQ